MTCYCSGYDVGQQQKILIGAVQDFSYPHQLFIIRDCLTGLQFCVVAKQREPYIVRVVTETGIVWIVAESLFGL